MGNLLILLVASRISVLLIYQWNVWSTSVHCSVVIINCRRRYRPALRLVIFGSMRTELLRTYFLSYSIFMTLPSMGGISCSRPPLIRTVSDGATHRRMLITRTEVVGGYLGVGILLDRHLTGMSRSAIGIDICPARQLFVLCQMRWDWGLGIVLHTIPTIPRT